MCFFKIYPRLLQGKFKSPSAPFNTKLELCGGHQVFLDKDSKSGHDYVDGHSGDPKQQMANFLQSNDSHSRQSTIIRKQTVSGEPIYIKIEKDDKG